MRIDSCKAREGARHLSVKMTDVYAQRLHVEVIIQGKRKGLAAWLTQRGKGEGAQVEVKATLT